MRILLPLLALSACSASVDSNAGTRSFPVPGNFDAVTLGGPDNVRVVTGGVPSIVATGETADLDKLTVELQGRNLIVSRKKSEGMRWGWSRNSKGVTVTVTVPRPISGAVLKGSGDLNVDQGSGARFDAELRGSGDLNVARVVTQAARLSVMGSGDLKVAGQARTVAIDLTGSGGVNASGLNAETAQVGVRGSGDVDARATRSANISLMGSGNASIRGTRNCTTSKRGSGEVRCTP